MRILKYALILSNWIKFWTKGTIYKAATISFYREVFGTTMLSRAIFLKGVLKWPRKLFNAYVSILRTPEMVGLAHQFCARFCLYNSKFREKNQIIINSVKHGMCNLYINDFYIINISSKMIRISSSFFVISHIIYFST